MRSVIALLGRRDSPTDGVQDYCEFLGRALEQRDVKLIIRRVEWMTRGWLAALKELWYSSKEWRGHWVVVQYTALSWSRHGFPLGAVAVVLTLRIRGVRCGVVFHEPNRTWGRRWLDMIRGSCQSWVIQRIYRLVAKAIFADSLETIRWLPKSDAKAAFIPIGANVPEPLSPAAHFRGNNEPKTVAIFCVTGAPHASIEIEDIAEAARSAVSNGSAVRFVFFGRGTPEAREQILYAFRRIPVDVSVLGLLEPEQDSRRAGEFRRYVVCSRCDLSASRKCHSGNFFRLADRLLCRTGNRLPDNRGRARTRCLSRPACAREGGLPGPNRRSLETQSTDEKPPRSCRIFLLDKNC